MKKKDFVNLVTTAVSYNGYSILKSELTGQQLALIKKELTVKPMVVEGYGNDNPEPFYLFNETKNKIYIPRFFGQKKIGMPAKNRLFKGKTISKKFNGSLREYQTKIVNSWKKHADKLGGGIISVGPGRGKTVMAIYIIAMMKKKTLILVHTSDLLTQWIERINEYLPTAEVGIIRGKKIEVMGKDVVIGMIHSISSPKKDEEYPLEMFKEFGMVIIDECHHVGAKMFSRCLKKTAFTYTLGLSATPNRQDGLTKVFKHYLGDICYKDNSIQKTAEELKMNHLPDADVHIYEYINADDKYDKVILNYKKKPNTVTMETNLSSFQPRTDFIISLLPNLVAQNRRIIILTSRRDQIADFIEKISLLSIGTVGPYVGGMKPDLLLESKKKQILVATYSMAEEGFDHQVLDTLIMATPKKKIEQCTGRIMRKKKNERVNIPLIIDIADQFSNFTNWNMQRFKFYKNKNYRISVSRVMDNLNDYISNDSLPNSENSNNSEQYIQNLRTNVNNKENILSIKSNIWTPPTTNNTIDSVINNTSSILNTDTNIDTNTDTDTNKDTNSNTKGKNKKKYKSKYSKVNQEPEDEEYDLS